MQLTTIGSQRHAELGKDDLCARNIIAFCLKHGAVSTMVGNLVVCLSDGPNGTLVYLTPQSLHHWLSYRAKAASGCLKVDIAKLVVRTKFVRTLAARVHDPPRSHLVLAAA